MNNTEIKNESNNKIGYCDWFLHEDKYGKDQVELIGYFWVRDKMVNAKGEIKETGSKSPNELCQKCYDYFSSIKIENIYERIQYKQDKASFTPIKWFYFYDDDTKKQAIENGRQLDYYFQKKASYHKTIALLKEDLEIRDSSIALNKEIFPRDKGTVIDCYVGDFGNRYCISCSTKRNDNSEKKLVMSLDNAKMCYECGMKKALGLVDDSNPDLIVKEKRRLNKDGAISYRWETLDKQNFANELQQELSSQQFKSNL